MGALIYAPLVALTYLSNPALLLSPGTVISALVVGGLFTGIRASLRYREFLRREALREP